MNFDDACDDIFSVSPMELSVGSLDLEDFDECLDQDMDSSVQSPPVAQVEQRQSPSVMRMQPRRISMDSMANMREQPALDGKSRVFRRRSTSFITNDNIETSMVVEDNDELPSSFLRASLAEQGPVTKRGKTDTCRLHRACIQENVSLESVQGMLREDPQAASRQRFVSSGKSVYSPASYSMVTKTVREAYTFPLNIALANNASAAVVEALVIANPSVLTKEDGSQQEASLHVLLRHKQADTAVVDAFLLANPSAAKVQDRHANTPLHVACRTGAPLDTVRHLCIMYPEAVLKRNFHDQTPLDLACSNIHMCSDEVADYLWVQVNKSMAPMLTE